MNVEAGQDVRVDVVANSDRPRALWLVFQAEPEESRPNMVRAAIEAARSDHSSFEGLVSARRGNLLVGAAWGQMTAGNTAVVWPPCLLPGEPSKTATALLNWVDQFLQSRRVRLFQVLLPLDRATDFDLLRSAGYSHASNLTYLACPSPSFPSGFPASPVTFEPYRLLDRTRLQDLVELTYENTLDCPALNGLRGITDVLDGYQSTGDFSPDRWFFVRHDNQDVGCLLLTDHPQNDQWELVYMGLIASARGNGWGEQIVRFAQRLTALAGRSYLVLAVDSGNTPAVDMYCGADFQAIGQRRVMLKTCRANDSAAVQ